MSPGEALRTLLFWRLFTLRFFTSYGIYAVSVHLVAYLADLGFSKIYGATVAGMIGVLGFGGSIALGYISDHLGRGKAMIIGFIFSALGVFSLLLAGFFAWQWIILLFLALFGLGYGARGPVFAALASDFFSGQSLGRIYGLITLGVGLGQATGPWMAGFLFDLTGSYIIPFVSVIISFTISVILTAGIEKMRLSPNAISAEVNILGDDRRDHGKR
jgi:MFS family permease